MIARAACKAIGWKGDKLPVGHVQSAPAVGLEKPRELGEHSTAGV